ncbi:hypothetical protein CSB09_03700 [Candidatus Gracilibacteria bacterium]|nr:MAG: hypothetical protein CSB09_03700 [Candidatus Gracilibacteria bacterium]
MSHIAQQTRNYYNANAEKYDAIHCELRPNERKHWKLLHTYISHREQSIKILEAGCGTGKDVQYAQENFGYESIGVDFSDLCIRIARKNFPHIPKDNFIVGDICDLPFQDESFDIVRQYASLVHMPKGEQLDMAITETHRVLRKGGFTFILMKHGEGSGWVNTKEGLPHRFFQYHSEKDLEVLMKKYHFKIRAMQSFVGDAKQPWVYVIAQK